MFGGVKAALIIVYYINGNDNPKNPVETRRRKRAVQNVTQLLLLGRLQSVLGTTVHKPCVSRQHLTEGPGARGAGLILQRAVGVS